jgi:uncharacterized Rossmann fold enzyme
MDDTVEWLRAYTAALADMQQFDDTLDEHAAEVLAQLIRATNELVNLRQEVVELKEWRRAAIVRITGI